MKVLILNGSPRPNGDTVCILERVKSQFPGDTAFSALNAYEENIQPCNDYPVHRLAGATEAATASSCFPE